MSRFTLTSVIVLVIVVVLAGIATVQLARTLRAAQRIDAKAERIARNGRGINSSTDSVILLARTNRIALSILRSARPLERELAGVIDEAQGIGSTAGGIDSTAGAINSTAGAIDSSAKRIDSSARNINGSARSIDTSGHAINSRAGRIDSTAGTIESTAGGIDSRLGSVVRVARRIDTDVRLINRNVDVTLALGRAIKGDTGNILAQATAAHDTAACIDRKLFGRSGEDGHCQGRPDDTRADHSTPVTNAQLERLGRLLDRPAGPAVKGG